MLPYFNPEEWREKVALDEDDFSLIMGPRDALAVLATRELMFAEHVPAHSASTDVFLFGLGEGPDRSGTKVGGLPFLQKRDPWPACQGGRPLPFLCQFNFTESRDIVGELVSDDVLLLFGDAPTEEYENPNVKFVWKSASKTRDLVEVADVPVQPSFDPFYGVRWRTKNYPCNDEYNSWSTFKPAQIQLATTLFATQISRFPFLFGRYGDPFDGRHLCCLTPINSTTPKEYPFVNRQEPIVPDWFQTHNSPYPSQSECGIRFPETWLLDSDSGTLYVYRTDHGDLAAEWIFG